MNATPLIPLQPPSSARHIADPSIANGLGETGANVRKPGRRLPCVDFARCLAVVMMVHGHTIDSLLSSAARQGAGYGVWSFVRGLTSPCFLLLAGLSFGIATERRWDSHTAVTPQVRRRILRFLGFVGLGYLMHAPARGLGAMAALSSSARDAFFAVDILQTIGITLITLQVLVLVARTKRWFVAITLILGTLVLGAAPWVRQAPWYEWTSPPVAAYLSSARGSLFPLFSWSAPILFGAAAGVTLSVRRWDQGARLWAQCALAAAVFMSLALLIGAVAPAGYRSGPPEANPDFILLRLACVCGVIAIFARLSVGVGRVPAVVGALSAESLSVYFVHVCLVYGSLWDSGLRGRLGTQWGPVSALGVALVVIASMVAMAWYWHQIKVRAPRVARYMKITIVALLVGAAF